MHKASERYTQSWQCYFSHYWTRRGASYKL